MSDQIIFGITSPPPSLSKYKSTMPKKIAAMHHRHGKREGEKCRTCIQYAHHQPGANTYRKCKLYGITSGPGTDWKASFDACGKWEKKV